MVLRGVLTVSQYIYWHVTVTPICLKKTINAIAFYQKTVQK